MDDKICLDERLPKDGEFKSEYVENKEELKENVGDPAVMEGMLEIHHKVPVNNLETESLVVSFDEIVKDMKADNLEIPEEEETVPEKAQDPDVENVEIDGRVDSSDEMKRRFLEAREEMEERFGTASMLDPLVGEVKEEEDLLSEEALETINDASYMGTLNTETYRELAEELKKEE